MKKHLYLIISLILIFIVGGVGFYYKSDIIKNQTILALYASFVGTLVGGLIGGLGSYYGGIQGAIISSIKGETHARKALYKQISYTHNIFEHYVANKSTDDKVRKLAMSENLLYDKNWNFHLVNCEGIKQEDFSIIVDWFNSIRNLEVQSTINDGMTPYDADEVCSKLSAIENVMKKYKKYFSTK